MSITLRDGFQAAMLGSLVGDIRGAQFEHKKQTEIRGMLEKQGGLIPVDYPNPWFKKKVVMVRKDQPTDDSELLGRYGRGLTRCREFNPEIIYEEMRAFITLREPFLAEEAFGEGSTLKSALEPATYHQSRAKFGRGEVPITPSNGALMCNTATYLRYHGDQNSLVRYSRFHSCITHMHPLSQAACVAHSILGSFILEGLKPEKAWTLTQAVMKQSAYKKVPDFSTIAAIEPTEPIEEELWPGGEDRTGDAGLSLRIAVWALVTAKDYRDGIEKCVRIGGDTDTYGAIAGGLLGARYGTEGIPAEWLAAAQGKEKMIDLADKLYDIAHS